MLTSVRTSRFWMRYLPYGWARTVGKLRRPDGCSNLPITTFWKEILKLVEHWVSFRRAAETSRRMQAIAIQNFLTQGNVRTESSHRPDGWCFRQMGVGTHRPDSWHFGQTGVRTVWHAVRTADRELNFLTYKLCRIFWKHFWIAESLLKSIFTKKWFCPTECGKLQTNKITMNIQFNSKYPT
jgi:hypothetical protein